MGRGGGASPASTGRRRPLSVRVQNQQCLVRRHQGHRFQEHPFPRVLPGPQPPGQTYTPSSSPAAGTPKHPCVSAREEASLCAPLLLKAIPAPAPHPGTSLEKGLELPQGSQPASAEPAWKGIPPPLPTFRLHRIHGHRSPAPTNICQSLTPWPYRSLSRFLIQNFSCQLLSILTASLSSSQSSCCNPT